jgi:hypothetical protein
MGAKLNDNVKIPFVNLNPAQLFYVAHPATGKGGKNTLAQLALLIQAASPNVVTYSTIAEMLVGTHTAGKFTYVSDSDGDTRIPTVGGWALYYFTGGDVDTITNYRIVASENMITTLITYISDEITAATLGLYNDRGNWDASGVDKYPSTGGSGVAGAIKKGDIWTVSVAGNGLSIGDTVRAMVDNATQADADWAVNLAGAADYATITGDPEDSAALVAYLSAEIAAAIASFEAVTSGTGSTTDGTTWVTIATKTLSANGNYLLKGIWLSGKMADGTAAFFEGSHRVKRVSGTVTAVGALLTILSFNAGSDNTLRNSAARINISGNDVQLQVRGIAATNISWQGGFIAKQF